MFGTGEEVLALIPVHTPHPPPPPNYESNMLIKCRVSNGIGTVLALDIGNLLHTGPKAAAESVTSVSRSLV